MTRSLQTLIRDLQRKRGRERRGLTLGEGIRLVDEALAAGVELHGAVISPILETTDRGKALQAALLRLGRPVEALSDQALTQLADTDHPQGVIAILEPRRWTLDEINLQLGAPTLVLDGVQDPGNVGTMLRTALGLGAAGVIALTGTVELTNPKVVRGSMGALFRLPAVEATHQEFLAWIRASGAELWVADVHGEAVNALAARLPERPTAVAIGNEGAGASAELIASADRQVSIPLRGPVESLNAATAAAILLYEVTRGH